MAEPPAAYWIHTLGLAPHPEGGYFRETYRSAFSTAIYFLLPGGQVSALHRIESDKLWHFHAGSGLTLSVIHPSGQLEQVALGPQPEGGARLQAVVPAGCWFGASVADRASYALVGCTVAPPFEFAEFELGDRARLLADYPQHRDLIERLTRHERRAPVSGHPRSTPASRPPRHTTNLFAAIAEPRDAERFDVLLETPAFTLERIVSTGQATPPGQWHDQARDEWVLVLRGSAGLRFEDATEPRLLRAGDHVVIPAGRRHRVEWTDATEPTVWVALHYSGR